MRGNCERTDEKVEQKSRIKHYSQLTLLLHFWKIIQIIFKISLNGKKSRVEWKLFIVQHLLVSKVVRWIQNKSLKLFDEWGWKIENRRVDEQTVKVEKSWQKRESWSLTWQSDTQWNRVV